MPKSRALPCKNFSLEWAETHGNFGSPVRLRIRADEKFTAEIFLDPAEIHRFAGLLIGICREINAPKLPDLPERRGMRMIGDGSF